MEFLLPGTAVRAQIGPGQPAEALLAPLFLAGGLMLSQVASLTGLPPHVIQNWVKRGYVSPPVNKRYTRRQFCRVALINMLRDSMQLEKITRLLSYVNGHLDDEADDLIDDYELYCAFVQLALRARSGVPDEAQALKSWCEQAVAAYRPVQEGARERVVQALEVMLVAHAAAQLKARADHLLAALDG